MMGWMVVAAAAHPRNKEKGTGYFMSAVANITYDYPNQRLDPSSGSAARSPSAPRRGESQRSAQTCTTAVFSFIHFN